MNRIAGVAVKRSEQMITKFHGNSMSYFGCAKCKSTLRNIETFRRADGNVLQLLTCTECDYKWKEIWLRGTNPNN
jgi:DNA-directed RNA polymerase subunit M/transcription elongation factor TFIIS